MNNFQAQSKSAAKELVATWLRYAAAVSAYHRTVYNAEVLVGDETNIVMDTVWDVQTSAMDGDYYAMVGPTSHVAPHRQATYVLTEEYDQIPLTDVQIVPTPQLWCFWPDFQAAIAEHYGIEVSDLSGRLIHLIPAPNCRSYVMGYNEQTGEMTCTGTIAGRVARVEILPLSVSTDLSHRELQVKFSNVTKDKDPSDYGDIRVRKPNRR